MRFRLSNGPEAALKAGREPQVKTTKIFQKRKIPLDKQAVVAYNMLKLFYLNNFN